nr:MAG TPA: hypothetical protein [Caudoviricetes sp.]
MAPLTFRNGIMDKSVISSLSFWVQSLMSLF